MKKNYSIPAVELVKIDNEYFMQTPNTSEPGPNDQKDPNVGGNVTPTNYMEFESNSERSDLKNPNVWK